MKKPCWEKYANSNISIDIIPLIGAGAYIVGEETAMLESIEGKEGYAKDKTTVPVQGLYSKPTIINNTETLASVPYTQLKMALSGIKIMEETQMVLKCLHLSGHLNIKYKLRHHGIHF